MTLYFHGMKTTAVLLFLIPFHFLSAQPEHFKIEHGKYTLTLQGASHLASLPLKCIQQHFPYKTGIVFSDSSLITAPENYHPAFCGCFDWHSSVHGHWMLVRLAKLFPSLPENDRILNVLKQQLTYANIQEEMKIFQQKDNRSFERTYGWAWVLQLQKELLQWKEPVGHQLSANVQPLADLFSKLYRNYLIKLAYPVRVGEHSNLAFGLKLAWDYAVEAKDDSLKASIRTAALRFYLNDTGCPIKWEPGGNDFLSPCLEEADLMWRILSSGQYEKWVRKFLPTLFSKRIDLPAGEVKDRTDGRLVHLDGLNFSRAWCLYGIANHIKRNRSNLVAIANTHLQAALPHVATGEYMGDHWLASFAVYALTAMNN